MKRCIDQATHDSTFFFKKIKCAALFCFKFFICFHAFLMMPLRRKISSLDCLSGSKTAECRPLAIVCQYAKGRLHEPEVWFSQGGVIITFIWHYDRDCTNTNGGLFNSILF